MMQSRSFHEKVNAELEALYTQFVQAQKNGYTTLQIPSPLCKYLLNFKGPKEVLHETCERLIIRIVDAHSRHFERNEDGCENMLAHMSLFLGTKIAFCSGLPNTEPVVRLLSEIYRCDGNFWNLLMGAYHEPQVCFEASGVQSLFGSLDEGVAAFRYFLHHANSARKLFFSNGVPKRMADLCLQEGSVWHPAVYAITASCPRTFKLLVEYGANLGEISAPRTANTMLEIIRRLGPENDIPEVKSCREIFWREHPEVLPKEQQTLMRLARRAIRRHLNESFLLPGGIEALPLPQGLKSYLQLDFD